MKVTIIENGPIVVDTKESVAIRAGGSNAERAGPLFLCRCGQSSSKPFCDGTHKKVRFQAPSAELVVG
jgi:CDGSH-type Zn-finger protein